MQNKFVYLSYVILNVMSVVLYDLLLKKVNFPIFTSPIFFVQYEVLGSFVAM